MLATFAFDVCHDVYQAAREAIDARIPTLNVEASGKYLWRPDRMPRLAEYVCDFARAGERALGSESGADFRRRGFVHRGGRATAASGRRESIGCGSGTLTENPQTEVCATFFRASRMAMFRVYYLGGADYQAARRHLGISELTWADWSEEIRGRVGRELTRAGVFPPSKYFRETTAKAS
jgi:hypothetical protein